jgi:hypothetical protein
MFVNRINIGEVTGFEPEINIDGSVTVSFMVNTTDAVVMNFENMETLVKLNSMIDKFIAAADEEIEELGNNAEKEPEFIEEEQ